jgi:hypothetical protein
MYLIPTLLLLSINSHASGLFYKFEQTNQAIEKKSQKKLNSLINRDFSYSDIKDIKNVSLDYDFLNTLNFYTPSRYILLSVMDKCSIYDLLTTDLAKASKGTVEYVIFNYENKQSEIKTHILKKNIFLSEIAYKQCPKIKKFKEQFNLSNIKNLLASIKFQIPKSYPQCFQYFKTFSNDPKSMYICDIVEKIRNLPVQKVLLRNMSKSQNRQYTALNKKVNTAIKYQKITKGNSYNILKSLCLNLNSQQKYCDSKLKSNYWTKMFKNNMITESVKNYCPIPYSKKTKLKNCINGLTNSPKTCSFSKISSLQPQPNCDNTARALNISRLYTEYKDCPGKVGSDSVVQYSRLLSHFNNNINENNKACYLNSTIPLAKYDKEFLDSTLWNVKLCYDDTLKRKEICTPVVMGESKESELSFNVVMGKILNRLKGFDNKQQSCSLVSSKEYRPALLRFKTGCYIIKDLNECDGIKCRFKVMIGETEFKKVSLKSSLKFDLFPNNFANENKSMLKLVQRYQKKRAKIIRNVSSFKRVYKTHLNAVYTGIGCAEQLLPSFFKTKNLNQCTFLPFIADGIVESNGYYSLVVRTAYDNIHAPRIIPWQHVYQGILQYQKTHPLNLWSFYALY